jgi:hypothetical protein
MHTHDATLPGFIRSKPNKAGDLCSYYMLDLPVGTQPRPSRNGQHKPPVAVADLACRNAVYGALCEVLGLHGTDRQALRDRGLSDQDIDAGRYATLPQQDRDKIGLAVLREISAKGFKLSDLLGVPGFYKGPGGGPAVDGKAGLLIPIMTINGEISGLVVRPDVQVIVGGKVLGKYRWITSTGRGGPGAVCSAHVPPGVSPPVETARITEGPLKAAVAQSKTGVPTIGLPGVGMWKLALKPLEALGVKRVLLAVDSDAAVKPNVAGALAAACRGLVAEGFEVAVEKWDPQFKGIDDCLVGGGNIDTLDGVEAFQFAFDQARRQGRPATVEPGHALKWVEWYLEQRDQRQAFREDTELLDSLMLLRAGDPMQYSAVEDILRKRKLLPAYNRWIKGATKAQKKARPAAPVSGSDLPYTEHDGCTFLVSHEADGSPSETKLARFTARITAEITRHEAGEQTKQFEVKATHADGSTATATIKATDFEDMAWVPTDLGSKYSIEPGRGTRDLMRHAVQLLSHRDGVQFRDIYTALGWHEITGEQVYLHAGGGISAAGPVAVHVEISKELSVYRPPEPDEMRFAQAAEQVLILHDTLGDDQIASVVVSLPFLAVLGPVRFVSHFSGSTGTCKTSIACMIARFFAPALERTDTMPATWSSTANGLQRAQHDAGDLVLVVDNLVANADQAARELFKADTVFNGQGDLGGRRRMRPDGTLAPALDPRGCLLSTGELDPQRQSALGRALVVEFVPGKFSGATLDQCHAAARAGHYAMTIACYVKHLAEPGKLDAQRQILRQLATQEQAKARKRCGGCHPRQAEAVGELVAAWSLFLDFAVAQGAVTRGRADNYVDEVRDSLFSLLTPQADIQRESDPGEMFLDVVRSLLASKRAVLFRTNGEVPKAGIIRACGFEQMQVGGGGGGTDWRPVPGAERIGWIDDQHVYLDPAAAHAAAERLARETRQVLGTRRQILSRLAETGRLVLDKPTPGTRRRFTRQATVENSQRRVIQMHRDEVLELATQQITTAPQTAHTTAAAPP